MRTWVLGLLLCVTPAGTGQVPVTGKGQVTVTATLVAPDLAVYRLALLQLRVVGEAATAADPVVAELTTGFDGTVSSSLDPGRYRLLAVTPLPDDNQRLSWDIAFEVRAGSTTAVELSNDNGRRSAAASAAPRSEGEIYAAASPAVFLIETDAGHGSGFLVDSEGLIVTNDHVLAKTRAVAVAVDRQRKYPAAIVGRDTDRDIAVVRIHPDAVAGATPLRLAGRDTPVAVGDRVLAIGSPLTTKTATLTTGVIGKVATDTLTSNVTLNPGNSGGPLLNLRGEVLGINTFGQQSAAGGPGIAGIVRIHVAEKALAEARASVAVPPPATLLPVAPTTPYPVAALRESAMGKFTLKHYRVEAGKIDVHVVTPPLAFYLEHETEIKAAAAQRKRAKGKGQTDPGADVYQWQADAGEWDAVVSIRAMPEVEMTGGSKAGRIFGGMLGVATPANYRFKTDFRAMKLLRNGVEVLPVRPGRICEAVQQQAGLNRLRDVGCMGLYQYDAEAFAPGGALELHVFTEDAPDVPRIAKLSPALVERVWHDFKPYFARLRKGTD